MPGVDGPTRPLRVREPATAEGARRPRGAPRPGATRRPRWVTVGAVLAVVALAIWGIVRLVSGGTTPAAIAPRCTVTTTAGQFTTSIGQAANGATIAAVGHRLGLPDHAVTVALAAGLQESRLINLSSGDRDSVGLFQQRPSEGWGTPSQLHDPVYASTAFYRALTKLPDWETLAVTAAAQAVQHSAAPDAYAAREAEARSLAIALTGEAPAALACHFTPAASPAKATWTGALAAELGSVRPGMAVSPSTGWVLAGWLVAHAQTFGITAVSFSGQTWTATTGRWRPGGPSDGTVHVS